MNAGQGQINFSSMVLDFHETQAKQSNFVVEVANQMRIMVDKIVELRQEIKRLKDLYEPAPVEKQLTDEEKAAIKNSVPFPKDKK